MNTPFDSGFNDEPLNNSWSQDSNPLQHDEMPYQDDSTHHDLNSMAQTYDQSYQLFREFRSADFLP
jgi:hypothetical protein